ncbi:DedA family protein [Candidatus Woesearchaeota archaeon]|nr:DedA family protein [Candidatus Woesearchaeota archaeon]
MQIVSGLIDWTKATFEPFGAWGLFALAFIESSFFPIPPDLLIIVLTLSNPEWWLLYAVISAIGSVLGAIFGYYIGLKGGLPLLKRLFSEDKISKVHKYFQKYEAWAIFIAGFTPIPFKVFTISAGVFYVDFKKFIIASSVSRFTRFFIVALLLKIYGEIMVEFIDKYFNILTIVGTVVIIGGYYLYKKNKKSKKRARRNKNK